MQTHEAYSLCHAHINKYVRITMMDGAVYDGIIEHVDHDHVYVAVPIREGGESRSIFGGPFGFSPFGFHPFGFGFNPFFSPFGFRRFGLPLFGLSSLSLLPFGFI